MSTNVFIFQMLGHYFSTFTAARELKFVRELSIVAPFTWASIENFPGRCKIENNFQGGAKSKIFAVFVHKLRKNCLFYNKSAYILQFFKIQGESKRHPLPPLMDAHYHLLCYILTFAYRYLLKL